MLSGLRLGKAPDKTLILHLGHQKTGTSSLQAFLKGSPSFLDANGFFYCAYGLRGKMWHHPLAQSILGEGHLVHDGLLEDGNLTRINDQIEAEFQKHPGQTGIISSEVLFTLNKRIVTWLRDLRRRGIRVKIVLYVRSPYDYMKSHYMQKAKSGTLTSTFNEYLVADAPRFRPLLKQFARAVDKRDFTIRVYDRSKLIVNDVVADFMDCLGIRNFGEEHNRFLANAKRGDIVRKVDRKKDTNPSISIRATPFMIALNALPMKERGEVGYLLAKHKIAPLPKEQAGPEFEHTFCDRATVKGFADMIKGHLDYLAKFVLGQRRAEALFGNWQAMLAKDKTYVVHEPNLADAVEILSFVREKRPDLIALMQKAVDEVLTDPHVEFGLHRARAMRGAAYVSTALLRIAEAGSAGGRPAEPERNERQKDGE